MTSVDVCTLTPGSLPLLVSVPHDGRHIPDDIAAGMTPAALRMPDTDWYVSRLYGFCIAFGASVLVANYSRYVVDLNRPATDEPLYPGQLATGVCPQQTFSGQAIYLAEGDPGDAERARRIDLFWRPYHNQLSAELARLYDTHGLALLWDAHSIRSEVPALFDGSLPELNLGSNGGSAADPRIEAAVAQVADASPYSFVANGRFRGGYITRHYGRPSGGVHALQLELAQRSYMDEAGLRYDPEAAERLQITLIRMLRAFVDSAEAIPGEGGQP